MKTLRSPRLFWMFCALLIATLACASPLSSGPTATPTAAPTTPVDSSAGAPSNPQGVAPISLPATRADQAGDVNSSIDATKKQAPGGDAFVNDLYERPFNANTMDTYFPYIDIVDTQGYKDDTWGYATITLSSTDANGKLPATYGVELDLNKDGRGDWLILAAAPSSTDWTTTGVKAWHDANGDVGGNLPIVADKASTGDGYETLVFDQGQGENNDGAWVRISPDDPKTVVIAFRLSMLGDPKSYAMGAWAGTDSSLDPARFDLNDHMTHIEAGSPLPGLQVYPLKGLSEIDNTCRLAIAFTPTGKEPGLCQTVSPSGGSPVIAACPKPASSCYPYNQKPYPNCSCDIPR